MFKRFSLEKSRERQEVREQYLVDGVASCFQKPHYADFPITITHGKGSKLYDVDGNVYIDYVLGFGPMILGFCPEEVNKAVLEQLKLGTHFSAPTDKTLELAKKLTDIIPCAELVSFQNSGTEVVMYALKLARAFTGKYKIIKFEGMYHGWSDEEKICIDAECVEEMGDRNDPIKIIHDKGQRRSSADDMYIVPFNDLELLEKTLKKHKDNLAAVVMEPVMFDSGPIMPQPGFLNGVRDLTKKYNILLIFDEVITGFRTSLGGAQKYFGVTPDLATFAKAIAGGYPFGVVAGRSDIMHALHPAGTFNGNPIGTVAALATIHELEKPGTYEKMDKLAGMLCAGFKRLGKKYGILLNTWSLGSICTLYFGFEENVVDFREWLEKADIAFYQRFVKEMEMHGVRFTSKRGRIYISTAHTEEDIHTTLAIADQVLYEILKD